MDKEEQLKTAAISAGGDEWGIFAELANDKEFQSLLTNQEQNSVREANQNPNIIQSYHRDQFANIVAKYPGWKIYKDSNLKQLKKSVDGLLGQIQAGEKNLADLQRNVQLTSGATALAAYATTFASSADKHMNKAGNLRWWYFGSIASLLITVGFVFFVNLSDSTFLREHLAEDVLLQFSLGIYIFKVALVFFFFQIVQFFRKNYNAEKHLEETYRHRSDVLQSLHAVYNSIDNKDEKDRLLSAAALFAYERGETGYITTKEGAGSGEGLAESFFSRLIK